MKRNGTPTTLSIVEKKVQRGTVLDAYGMTILGCEKLKQLQGIARTIASAKAVSPVNLEVERNDLMGTMALFTETLGHIQSIIDEARIILEELDPKLRAVNE